MTKNERIRKALYEALDAIDRMVAADPSLAEHAEGAKQGLREAAALAQGEGR